MPAGAYGLHTLPGEGEWEVIFSQLLAKLGDEEGSKTAMDLALGMANAGQLHNYGRQLIGQDKKQEALAA